VQPSEHKRKPNGILGLLCRQHFSGLVMHAGVLEPAYMWDHYMASPDATDREGRNITTKARRVVGEICVSHSPTKMVEIPHSVSIFVMMMAIMLWVYMQDFYRCEECYEARANEQAHQACYKLVKDIHYEARRGGARAKLRGVRVRHFISIKVQLIIMKNYKCSSKII